MYDKIKFFIPRTSSTQYIAKHLEKVRYTVDTHTGERSLISGTIGGMKVMEYPNGVFVVGSLPKFYNDNKSNVFTQLKQQKRANQKVKYYFCK